MKHIHFNLLSDCAAKCSGDTTFCGQTTAPSPSTAAAISETTKNFSQSSPHESTVESTVVPSHTTKPLPTTNNKKTSTLKPNTVTQRLVTVTSNASLGKDEDGTTVTISYDHAGDKRGTTDLQGRQKNPTNDVITARVSSCLIAALIALQTL